jgi:inhibitor of KinA sporulation pathway (predicted exonuclease)
MSKTNYSRFFVVDLELTCWADMPRSEQLAKNEIIEIGLTEIDLKERKILKSNSYLVKPKNLDISDFCTSLTGITKQQLESASDLTKVSKQIRNDFPYFKNTPWGAWGDDYYAVVRDCASKNAVNPFSDNYYDLQELYTLSNGLDKRVKLNYVLEKFGMTFQGREHSGKDDSYNTALVLLKMWER